MDEAPVFQADREGRFLLSASHELKTPLTAIRGYAEGLAEGVFTAEEAVETILVESSRLEQLIRDLLDVARIERGCFSARSEPIDLMTVGRASLARHEAKARRHGVALVAEGGEHWVTADPGHVDRVVSNLLACALRQAYAPGSTVEIRAGERGLGVSSTGAGVSPDARLGLVIARTLALAMGGDVSVEIDHSRGTTFMLRLPRAVDRDPESS